MEVEKTTRTYGVSRRRLKSRMNSLLLVGSQETFKNTGVARVFNGSRFQLVARSSTLWEALTCFAPGTIDLALLSDEYREEEVALFAADARRRGYLGLILHAVDTREQRLHPQPEGNDPVQAGDLVISASRHQVWIRGEEIRCCPLEFELLAYLCRHPDEMLSHESLLEALWGDQRAPRQSLRGLISSVRAKIETTTPPSYIVTQRHVGYRFVPSPGPIY
jgi:DNA-binding winged helix-turn-helix (wHTH) protein